MFSPTDLLLFVSASLLLIVAPGPDILFLVTVGMSQGPRAGAMTALGLAGGNLVHTVGAALGLSAIILASPLAFAAIKLAGAAYLAWLAWQTIRHRRDFLRPVEAAPRQTGVALLRRGFFMNVLNPKVALFFLAFLPQFARADAGPLWAQMIILGLIFTVLVVVVFGVLGMGAGQVGRYLLNLSTGARAAVSWLVAGVFLYLAVRLTLSMA